MFSIQFSFSYRSFVNSIELKIYIRIYIFIRTAMYGAKREKYAEYSKRGRECTHTSASTFHEPQVNKMDHFIIYIQIK